MKFKLDIIVIILLAILMINCAAQRSYVVSSEGGVTMKGPCSSLPWNVVKYQFNGVYYFVSYNQKDSIILIDIKHPANKNVTFNQTYLEISRNEKRVASTILEIVKSDIDQEYSFRTKHCVDGLLWQGLFGEECKKLKHFRYTTSSSKALTRQIDRFGEIFINVPAILIDGKLYKPKPVRIKNEMTYRGVCVF